MEDTAKVATMRHAARRLGSLAVGAVAVLATVATALPEAEARFRLPSVGRARPRPPLPHVPIVPHAPVAPRAPASGSAASLAVGLVAPSARPSSLPAAAAPQNTRGFFGRMWDKLLGRRPEPTPPTPAAVPAPAPAAPRAALAQAPPAAAPAGARAPGVSIPVVVPSAVPVPASGQDEKRGQAVGATPSGAGEPSGAGGSTQLASALKQQPFGPGAGRPGPLAGAPSSAAAAGALQREAPPVKPPGYVVHLSNGRALSTEGYRESGDQVVIEGKQGSYSLPKSLVRKIEER